MKFIGFHGTEAKNIDNIQAHGYMPSLEDEWMGEGVYFFETMSSSFSDGFEEAQNWVIYVKKLSKWAVFKATIVTSKYIDLASKIEHRKMYDRIKEESLLLHEKAGNNVKEFNENIIYQAMGELSIDLIRAIVDASHEYRYHSYTVRRPQLQICVKNQDCIKKNVLVKTWRSS